MRVGFGYETFGETVFGSGDESLRQYSQNALAINYQVLPPGSAAVPVSYHIQVITGAACPVVYSVVPPYTSFTINGTLVAAPNAINYNLPSQIGYDLTGIPIQQGWTTVIWSYETLLDADIATLMSLYDPDNPLVVISYPNELGYWVTKEAMMQPPDWGNRTTVIHSSVTLTFTHISSD